MLEHNYGYEMNPQQKNFMIHILQTHQNKEFILEWWKSPNELRRRIDRDKDIIKVVERVNGRREYREYPKYIIMQIRQVYKCIW